MAIGPYLQSRYVVAWIETILKVCAHARDSIFWRPLILAPGDICPPPPPPPPPAHTAPRPLGYVCGCSVIAKYNRPTKYVLHPVCVPVCVCMCVRACVRCALGYRRSITERTDKRISTVHDNTYSLVFAIYTCTGMS